MDFGEFHFKDGTLTVNPATLTVTAQDKSKTYGDANPTLTGVKNNDDITDSYSTTATQENPAGTYDIVPSLNDPNNKLGNYTVSKNNGKLTVNKRQARVVYNGQNFASRSTQGSETINLSANVSRLPNDTSGDLTKATVEFHIKNFNGSTLLKKTAPVTLNPDASGTAVTTALVPTSDDPYTIEVQIDTANKYWTSTTNGATTGITDIGTLQVIFGTATGRTAGGGWIPDQTNAINGRSNFGFTVANSKTGLRGNHVYIYRTREDGKEVQYVVKSNSWQGGNLTFNVNNDRTRATFTGKATVQRYVNGVQDTTFSGGNYTFTVNVFDGDLKTPRETDGYAISVRNSSNVIVKQQSGSASSTTPLTMGGGNVLIQAQ